DRRNQSQLPDWIRFTVRGTQRQSLAASGNALGCDDAVATAGLDRLLNPSQRMLCQQLQHADELPGAGPRAVAYFKMLAQLGKRRRQTSVAINVGVIKIGWLDSQRGQVVQRIQHLLALTVRPLVLGNPHSVADDFDTIDVGFYRDRRERMPP